MQVIHSIAEMQSHAELLRRDSRRICLVPTMGFLHEGHLSLMHMAARSADVVVASVFVNPTQFGPGEDFEQYPRDWDRDMELLRSAAVEVVFAPAAAEMYPEGFQTSVELARVTRRLCGLSRPTHFAGVATVVAKLFLCTRPHCAVFGQKDYQQLQVIRRMVADLNFGIEIIPAPIVREPDGLAMSSRNIYLRPAQRRAAQALSQSLREAQQLIDGGERDPAVLTARARELINAAPEAEIDYITVCDPETLEDCPVVSGQCLMALAVRYGSARLIDNAVLHVPVGNQ